MATDVAISSDLQMGIQAASTTEFVMTNEYQPLDPKEWLADPDGWELELFRATWVSQKRYGPIILANGKLENPDLWRMRRKAKVTVKYICIGGDGRAHFYDVLQRDDAGFGDPMPNQYIVTFGPDDESSSCRMVK
jgi:hypothetical protein